MRTFAVLLALIFPTLAFAQTLTDRQSDYVGANTIASFHHELAHALIDIQLLPVFGQEEDNADVLSILMIDYLFDEDTSLSIAYDTANGFYFETLQSESNGEEPAFWDVHGISEQRYFNTICLYYGGDTAARADFAEELGLPDDRAETCEDERALADDSWGAVLDEMDNADKTRNWVTLSVDAPVDTPARKIWVTEVTAEIEGLNQWLELADELRVTIAECGEANAFYDLYDKQITMCVEYADFIGNAAAQLFTDN